jgi:hypothetical protein
MRVHLAKIVYVYVYLELKHHTLHLSMTHLSIIHHLERTLRARNSLHSHVSRTPLERAHYSHDAINDIDRNKNGHPLSVGNAPNFKVGKNIFARDSTCFRS